MSQATSKGTHKAAAKPVIKREYLTPDNVAVYGYFYNESDSNAAHHPVVDLVDGTVDCPDCKDWECRRLPAAREAGVRPHIADIKYQCKHIKLAVLDCIQKGEIEMRLRSFGRKINKGK